MKKLNTLSILLFFLISNVFSQENEYLKTNEMRGIPHSVKRLFPYDQAKEYFDFFDIDEKSFNSIFYKNLIKENGQKSSFIRLNVILTKKLMLKTKLFPKYEIVINPKIEKGYFSKQRLTINIREESITSHLLTHNLEIIFPKETLQTDENTNAILSIKTDNGLEYNNDVNLNTNVGLNIKNITDYSIKSSFIPNTIIELLKFNESQLKFINNGKSDQTIFEDNRIYDFVDSYQKRNSKYRMKKISQYKTAIMFKNTCGLAHFHNSLKFQNSEIYFFKNIVAGVLEFPLKKKKKLLKEINSINNIINMSDLELNENGDFPTFYDSYNGTYYKTEQDFKSVRMYFIIEK